MLYPPGTPPAARLQLYTNQFATVELNASFYRWPADRTSASWRRRVQVTQDRSSDRGLGLAGVSLLFARPIRCGYRAPQTGSACWAPQTARSREPQSSTAATAARQSVHAVTRVLTADTRGRRLPVPDVDARAGDCYDCYPVGVRGRLQCAASASPEQVVHHPAAAWHVVAVEPVEKLVRGAHNREPRCGAASGGREVLIHRDAARRRTRVSFGWAGRRAASEQPAISAALFS